MISPQKVFESLSGSNRANITPVGVDLTLACVREAPTTSKVFCDKTVLEGPCPVYNTVMVESAEGLRQCWCLRAGAYKFIFNEGVRVPEGVCGRVVGRSSLYRSGTLIDSPWWDPGFHAVSMTTVCIVYDTLIVEKNARVATLTYWPIDGELTYNGQWQGGAVPGAKTAQDPEIRDPLRYGE